MNTTGRKLSRITIPSSSRSRYVVTAVESDCCCLFYLSVSFSTVDLFIFTYNDSVSFIWKTKKSHFFSFLFSLYLSWIGSRIPGDDGPVAFWRRLAARLELYIQNSIFTRLLFSFLFSLWVSCFLFRPLSVGYKTFCYFFYLIMI